MQVLEKANEDLKSELKWISKSSIFVELLKSNEQKLNFYAGIYAILHDHYMLVTILIKLKFNVHFTLHTIHIIILYVLYYPVYCRHAQVVYLQCSL